MSSKKIPDRASFEIFRSQLRKAAKKKYGTLANCAEAIGIKPPYLSKILTGMREPGLWFFWRLNQLGFNLNNLFKSESEVSAVKDTEVTYSVEFKTALLRNLVGKVEKLFIELNEIGINLDQEEIRISQNLLQNMIQTIRELVFILDETILENQKLIDEINKISSDSERLLSSKIKTYTTQISSRIDTLLKGKQN